MRSLILCLLLCGSPWLVAQDGTANPPAGLPDPPAAESTDNPKNAKPVPAYQEPRAELPTSTRQRGRTEIYTDMLGSLLLVLGLIMGLAIAFRKFFPNQLMGQMEGKSLRLVQTLAMGPKRHIALIEADGKRLLVGVTENQINLIKSLDEVDFNQTLADVEPPKTVGELMGEEVP